MIGELESYMQLSSLIDNYCEKLRISRKEKEQDNLLFKLTPLHRFINQFRKRN